MLRRHEEGWRFWILAVGLLITLLSISSACFGQALGVNYSWSDSLQVGITGRDSTFSVIWESVNIWFRGGEGYVRFGAPDTAGWYQRKFIRLADNQVLSFDAGTKLRRLQFKAGVGTVTIYFVGYKKRRQF